LKIVIVQGAFLPVPPVQGGAVEKLWYRMGKEFAALGHEVVHISKEFKDFPREEYISGVKHIRVKGYETPASLVVLKLLDLFYAFRAIKKIPADVDVIVTNTFWAPFLLRGKTGRKVYVSVERAPKGQMRFYKHAGFLRGCSPAIAAAVKQELPESLHSKVTYVPNAVPFDIKVMDVKREKTILFVGRLHPEKGVHVLLKAFQQLAVSFADWKLLIVGPHESKDGGGGETYYSQLQALRNSDQIVFTGPVFNDDQLIEYYATSSVFCYPAQSGSGDAAPVAPREAMAYGCVPVVSKLACFGDFITDGTNGLQYNQEDADQETALANTLRELMVDNDRLVRMAEEGKKINASYAPKVVALQFVEDFKRLMSESSR
jgi:glycosyltransferase involved in cell wall biosynthesis